LTGNQFTYHRLNAQKNLNLSGLFAINPHSYEKKRDFTERMKERKEDRQTDRKMSRVELSFEDNAHNRS